MILIGLYEKLADFYFKKRISFDHLPLKLNYLDEFELGIVKNNVVFLIFHTFEFNITGEINFYVKIQKKRPSNQAIFTS